MKFAVLGSCIAGETIIKWGWENVSNNVSYSHIAFIDNKCSSEFVDLWEEIGRETSSILFNDATPANLEKLEKSICPGIYESIQAANPDYVIVDLADFRLGEYVIDIGHYGQLAFGMNVLKRDDAEIFTKWLEDRLCVKASLKEISISDLSDEELDLYIRKHIDRLREIFGSEKLIFFRPRLVCNYLDNDQIKYTPYFQIQGDTNDIFDRIYSIADQYISYINAPDYLIGDAEYLSPFEYHFSKPYYEYLASSIEYIIQGGDIDEYIEQLRVDAGNRIYSSYNRIFCEQIINKMSDPCDKRIVLVARTRQFEQILFEKYNTHLYKYLYYDKNTSIITIEEKIQQILDGQNPNDYIFVAPELFNHGKKDRTLQSVFMRFSLKYMSTWFTFVNYVVMNNFKGKFVDVFNNEVESKSNNGIVLHGGANRILIHTQKCQSEIEALTGATIIMAKSKWNFKSKITVWWDGYLSIGENNSCGFGIRVLCHLGASIEIGNDNMFSWNVLIIAGDGHSIFEKKNGVYTRISPNTEQKIAIGNHVWVGFDSVISVTSKIRDGCIVGSGSYVNKTFPNNVIIVGRPAKIVRKNIAWCRDVFTGNIELDNDVYSFWANETEGIN